MEFFNQNVAAELAQILKNYQEKYVPCFGGEVLSKVPVHGDQLCEEREGETFSGLSGMEKTHMIDWKAYEQSMLTGMLRSHCTR